MVRNVVAAADRGNPVARWLVRRETRDFYASLAQPSPLYQGEYRLLPRCGDEEEDDWSGIDQASPGFSRTTVTAEGITGRRIADASLSLGLNGMGNLGFFGLDLGEEWLVLPLRDAGRWVFLDGRILLDPGGRGSPWISGGDDRAFLRRAVGARIVTAEIGAHALAITLDNGAQFVISPDPSTRPRIGATGQRRTFHPDDDLAAALFLTPTPDFAV